MALKAQRNIALGIEAASSEGDTADSPTPSGGNAQINEAMENPFELHPYNPKLKHSDKAPVIHNDEVWDWYEVHGSTVIFNEQGTAQAYLKDCQQLVLKITCKACGGEGCHGDGTPCPVCETDGHTLLIVQDKPCERCNGEGLSFPGFGTIKDCSKCQGFGGVSVEKILSAIRSLEKYKESTYVHTAFTRTNKHMDESYLTYCEGIITKTE